MQHKYVPIVALPVRRKARNGSLRWLCKVDTKHLSGSLTMTMRSGDHCSHRILSSVHYQIHYLKPTLALLLLALPLLLLGVLHWLGPLAIIVG